MRRSGQPHLFSLFTFCFCLVLTDHSSHIRITVFHSPLSANDDTDDSDPRHRDPSASTPWVIPAQFRMTATFVLISLPLLVIMTTASFVPHLERSTALPYRFGSS
jgi:hypothetical protein